MAKKKKKTTAQEAESVAVKLQKLVRMKAADDNGYASCVTCGYTAHWKEMDGGHFFSRSKSATKLLEENIHVQCKGCNLRMGRGDTNVMLAYRDYMIDMYTLEEFERMRELSRLPHKWTRDYIDGVHDYVKQGLKEQEQRLGDV